MKTFLLILAALLIFGTGAAIANHDHGKHKGWQKPGHPHNYASPHADKHP